MPQNKLKIKLNPSFHDFLLHLFLPLSPSLSKNLITDILTFYRMLECLYELEKTFSVGRKRVRHLTAFIFFVQETSVD